MALQCPHSTPIGERASRGLARLLLRFRGWLGCRPADPPDDQWQARPHAAHDLRDRPLRLNTLFYNWWSLFMRLIEPESRREAKTSRPLMMDGVARVRQHSRQTTLLLTIAHSAAAGSRAAFEAMTSFLREIQDAPQLTSVERWCRILGRAL